MENEVAVRLAEAKEGLQKLKEEQLDYLERRSMPELASTGKMLAEYNAFVIDCLENGVDPDEYACMGYAHPKWVKTRFGVQDGDRTTPAYNYNWEGRLKEDESVVLWRKISNVD